MDFFISLIQGKFIFTRKIYQTTIFITVTPNFPGEYFLGLLFLVAVSGVGGICQRELGPGDWRWALRVARWAWGCAGMFGAGFMWNRFLFFGNALLLLAGGIGAGLYNSMECWDFPDISYFRKSNVDQGNPCIALSLLHFTCGERNF